MLTILFPNYYVGFLLEQHKKKTNAQHVVVFLRSRSSEDVEILDELYYQDNEFYEDPQDVVQFAANVADFLFYGEET
jgi:hypothetical protein